MITHRQYWLLVMPFPLIAGPFLVLPMGFITSFTNYAPVQASIRNVAVFTVVTMVLDLGLGLCLAYLLRDTFRGGGLLRLLRTVYSFISA